MTLYDFLLHAHRTNTVTVHFLHPTEAAKSYTEILTAEKFGFLTGDARAEYLNWVLCFWSVVNGGMEIYVTPTK